MNILKKLKLRIVIFVVAVMTIFLATMLSSVIFWISHNEKRKAIQLVEMLVDNGGNLPGPDFHGHERERGGRLFKTEDDDFLYEDNEPLSEPPHFHKDKVSERSSDFFTVEIRGRDDIRNYFSVILSSHGDVVEVICDFPTSFTRDEISILVRDIMKDARGNPLIIKDRKRLGQVDDFVYCVLKRLDDTYLVALANRRSELLSISVMGKIALNIFIVSIAVTLFISLFISNLIVKPVQEAFIKQRQFIADASHELKTPVAVIGANLDVLMSEMSENRWLNYIKSENERMGHLVKNLLYLAKNDADRMETQYAKFDFSSAIANAILPFESVVFEEKKRFEIDIAPGIEFVGDEHQIKQIAVIFVDNAIKNSDENALIRVSAKVENNKILLKVFNTGHGIKKEDLKKIFLRFYRSDFSRARKTGGYGLGLSIAQAMAQAHHGTISAASEEGKWAEFTLVLPAHPPRLRLF